MSEVWCCLGIISESWSIYYILLEDSRVGVLVCDSHGVDVSYTSRTKYSHGVDVSYPLRTREEIVMGSTFSIPRGLELI